MILPKKKNYGSWSFYHPNATRYSSYIIHFNAAKTRKNCDELEKKPMLQKTRENYDSGEKKW